MGLVPLQQLSRLADNAGEMEGRTFRGGMPCQRCRQVAGDRGLRSSLAGCHDELRPGEQVQRPIPLLADEPIAEDVLGRCGLFPNCARPAERRILPMLQRRVEATHLPPKLAAGGGIQRIGQFGELCFELPQLFLHLAGLRAAFLGSNEA